MRRVGYLTKFRLLNEPKRKNLSDLTVFGETMKIEAELARMIVDEDAEDWEKVYGTQQITGHGRWSVNYQAVFLNKSSNKFYLLCWNVGATEMQDEQPFEYLNEVEITEVQKAAKMVIAWEPVVA